MKLCLASLVIACLDALPALAATSAHPVPDLAGCPRR
jgi:hypothetical protein